MAAAAGGMRARWLVVVVALGVLLTGCTGGDDDDDPAAATTTTDAGSRPGDGPEAEEDADDGPDEASPVEFRPVLQANLPYDAEAARAGDDPCAEGAARAADATTTAPGATAPADQADTVVLPDRPDPAEAPVACTWLGPAGFTGAALIEARAEAGQLAGGGWVVTVMVAPEQRARANELINACASGAATCPADPLGGAIAGQLAIVVDGEVISAPTVNEPNLADQQLIISGGGSDGFSEAEAEELAARLRS